MPWNDGRKYVATVVWVGADTARVEFEDGSVKTVSHEELEPLNTPAPVDPSATSGTTVTSQQSKSSRTASRTERVTDPAALEAKLKEDNWTITEVPRPPGKACARITDKYYRKPGESKQYRSLLGIARAHYPEFIRGRASSPAQAVPVPPPRPPPLPTDPCAICMSTITEDACVLECGHVFHAACLGEMADHVGNSARTRRSLGVTCPLCRKVTRAEVGAEEVTSQT